MAIAKNGASSPVGKTRFVINESRLTELFLKLLSFNAPSRDEAQIVSWTEGFLRSYDLEVWQDQAGAAIGGNANNLIARLPATDVTKPSVFFSAHFDTVEPTLGLEVLEDGGVFRSAGDTILGADDRAGMAPAIEAVLSFKESGLPHGNVYLLLSVAEEIGLLGAANMELDQVDVDYGFVLDTGPPVGSYVTQAATHDKLTVRITGKPAHSGKDPERGINAIQIAARAIEGMTLGRIGPTTTANIGKIVGGSATNVVCPEVSVYCEARSRSIPELDSQIEQMKLRFEEAADSFGGKVEFEHHRHYEGYDLDPESALVRTAIAASQALGLEPELRVTLGGSDANIFNKRGIPSIVVATGMQQIHTQTEHVSRVDLVNTARVAYELLRQSNA
jgi:tripeptide aminopeptidase